MTFDPPLYLQTGEYSARQLRWFTDRIFSEGVSDVQAGELLVTQRAAGTNLSVDVAAGTAIITGDSTVRQGKYLVRLIEAENVAIPAPPGANSRIDLVVLQVHDSTSDGGSASLDGAALEVVQGVAAPVPVAPAVPATAIALAEVKVAAGVVNIVTANITDRRTQLNATTLDVGTQAIPLTTAQRDALNNPKPGTLVFNTSTGRLDRYNGAAWVPDFAAADVVTPVTGSYVGDNVANRLISLPFQPKLVYLTSPLSAYLSPVTTGLASPNTGAALSSGGTFIGPPDAASGLGRPYRLPGLDPAGFRVGVNNTPSTNDTNYTGTTYRYVAFN